MVDETLAVAQSTPVPTLSSAIDGKRITTEHNDSTYMRRAFWTETPSSMSLVGAKKSTGYMKWTDTSIGGNYAINTPYQFTSFADIHANQFVPVGYGMGRFYSEAIDDNRHDIHMRFGVQEFNTFAGFFLRWFDYGSSKLARTGRTPGFMYTIGNILSFGVGWVLPMTVIAAHLLQLALASDSTSFWNVRPTMGPYWSTVNNLANTVSTNMSITTEPTEQELMKTYENFADTTDAKILFGSGGTVVPRSDMEAMQAKLPDVWRVHNKIGETEGFSLDVMSVSSRAQRQYDLFNYHLQKKLDKLNISNIGNNITSRIGDEIESAFTELAAKQKSIQNNQGGGLTTYLDQYYRLVSNDNGEDSKGNSISGGESEGNKNTSRFTTGFDSNTRKGFWSSGDNTNTPSKDWLDFMNAEMRNGSGWVTFRVNGRGQASESFSNSAEESTISSTINGFAKTAESTRFNIAGGNVLGETVKAAVGGVIEGAAGILGGLGLGGIVGLFTGSFVDIPKTWSGSSSRLSTMSYDLQLRTPYGHRIAVFQDLYLPTFCLMAGTIPLSHGPMAHGSPFYVEVYDKGRCVVKRGLIESLTINRGVGNLPWSPETDLPTAIDISFSILDLSNIMHVPITTYSTLLESVSPGNILQKLLIGPDTALDDYLSVLGALGIHDQIYRSRRIKRNIMNFVREWQSRWSMTNFMTQLGTSSTGQFLNNFVALQTELRR